MTAKEKERDSLHVGILALSLFWFLLDGTMEMTVVHPCIDNSGFDDFNDSYW